MYTVNNSTYSKTQHVLLIAEKASARKDMEVAYSQLPSNYPYKIDFANASGHLVGLQEPDLYCDEWKDRKNPDILPMIPSQWQMKVVNPKPFQNLKELLRSNDYDFVINACDPGREGFLIFDNIYKKSGCKLPVKRLWYDDQTPETLVAAFQNLHDYDDYIGYRNSALFRSILDWLIGMNFSRAATIATGSSFIIGRCITVILGMIVNVEKQIQNFVPQDYYEYAATFTTQQGDTYKGLLINPNNKENKYQFFKRDVLERLPFAGKTFKISEIKKEEVASKPRHMLNLTDLQVECSRKFGYSPDETLSIAQSLYETHKVLSYPRTDCRFLTTSIADRFPELISSVVAVPEISSFAQKALYDTESHARVAKNKSYVNNKKITEHHALIPTNVSPSWEKLNDKEKNVYTVVAKRFIAMFLPNCIHEKTTIITTLGNAVFISTGKTLIQLGWREIYGTESKDVLLPNLQENEPVTLSEGNILDKKTKPPARYTHSSLLLAMENASDKIDEKDLASALVGGIGTSATRAELLKKIVTYGWAELKKGANERVYFPTKKGIAIIDALKDQIIISPAFTAAWEQKFIDMEISNTVNRNVYNEIVAYVTENTGKLLNELKPNEALKDARKELGTCPWCKKEPFIEGKTAYYCSGFLKRDADGKPDCSFGFKKHYAGATLTNNDVIKLLETGSTPEKKFKRNTKKTEKNTKDNRDSFFTSRLVYTEKDIVNENGEITGKQPSLTFPPIASVGLCPVCSNNVLSLNQVYTCSNRNCDFHMFKINVYGTTINEADAASLLGFKKIRKNCISKLNQPYPAYLFLERVDENNEKVQYKIGREYLPKN